MGDTLRRLYEKQGANQEDRYLYRGHLCQRSIVRPHRSLVSSLTLALDMGCSLVYSSPSARSPYRATTGNRFAQQPIIAVRIFYSCVDCRLHLSRGRAESAPARQGVPHNRSHRISIARGRLLGVQFDILLSLLARRKPARRKQFQNTDQCATKPAGIARWLTMLIR